ncbi:transcription factor domain-containing protein [Dothistroma septosporum NZE10]|uniref:Transcription factor domain-containing protein n=1 Tax=Dothistroma septosporum (strain NZE10 / CBS 128990) TaxID=675120 RepID=N1PRY1_DOTSN|nr:transcription factor domain-containing protein [Dothistroma septosporum NZE10]
MAPNSKKRERDADALSPDDASAASPTEGGASTTNFRNVSACNRCRNRKNRCDQKLPKCTNCEKARVRCVGFDPVSKREIPRSYVYYLETRVRNLEAILSASSLPFPPPSEDFAIDESIKPGVNVPFPVQDEDGAPHKSIKHESPPEPRPTLDPSLNEHDERDRLGKLVNDIGMVSVQGATDSRLLGSSSGISFAKVVFAAVKRSVNQTPTSSEKAGTKSSKLPPLDVTGSGTSMRDSFFGLHSKPTIKPAPFPERELGSRLAELYFEHANPQIPVLHRGEFMSLFDRVYATDAKKRTSRELYMLNIVFAIGSGIIMDSAGTDQPENSRDDSEPPSTKRQRLASHQHQPEEYHASAIVHLESFLGSSPAAEGVGGGLEELQAVILLAGLALLRPVAPGLWYIIGVAVRLSIDLGLHFEDVDPQLDSQITRNESGQSDSSGLGRKQWTRDLRRRLWWCVFNLDRLVSSCVGRPVSISEAVVTTEFPSMLDDAQITPAGFFKPPNAEEIPSYKLVSRHYIRLRLLQSEILQVLQHRQAEQARQVGAHRANGFVQSGQDSSFMRPFRSFREWRADVDARLWEWKDSAPQPYHTGVAFNPLFLELNYWQAIIMLYRQSLTVPEPLAGELSPATGDDVQSPGAVNLEREEDKQMVFLKVAQAGQTVLKTYRQLHRLKLVNYTFLATHHLFMSGISFLYAIWHSTLVRSQLTIDDVDFTVLAATSVLSDLVETCPPAEACRDAFVRMSKATISMVMSTTGFGNASTLGTQPLNHPDGYFGGRSGPQRTPEQHTAPPPKRPMPRFDMNLKDLFSEEEIASRPVTHQSKLQGFLRPTPRQPPMSPQLPTNAVAAATSPHGTEGASRFSPREEYSSQHGRTSSSTSYQTANQPSYQPFSDTMTQTQPEYSFDNLDFLNDFPATSDPSTAIWGHASSDMDLGFGSGGTAGFDGSGAWEANGELFDSFFFGNGNGY